MRRAGEDAPTFAVRITYLQPIQAWADKTLARLDLPALDLPVSRTGVVLHHSPRLRVGLAPGAFRLESDPGVFAEALRAGHGVGFGLEAGLNAPVAAAMPPPPQAARSGAVDLTLKADSSDTQFKKLIDRYRNEGGGRTVSGTLPVSVTFPAL